MFVPMRALLGCLSAIVCLLSVLPPARAALFRDEQRKFQVHVASIWKPLPESVTQQIAAATTQRGGRGAQVLAGYSQASSTQPVPPFFVIFYVPDNVRGLTLERLESSLLRGVKSGLDQAARDNNMDFSAFNPSFDRARMRMQGTTEIQAQGVSLSCKMVGYVLADGIVMFALYSRPEQATKDQANLELALMSFKSDPGTEFVPAPPGSPPPTPLAGKSEAYKAGYRIGQAVGGVFMLAVLAGAIAGVLWIVRKLGR